MFASLTVLRNGAALILGVVLLNTLPVWLAELSAISSLSSEASGLIASLILVSSAIFCIAATRIADGSVFRACAAVLIGAFGLAALTSGLPAWGAFALALGIGVSLGALLNRSLAALSETEDPVPVVSQAIGVGLVVSLALLTVAEVMNLLVFPLITGTAVIAVVLSWPTLGRVRSGSESISIGEIHLVPFFLAMGAYWVFLELYAQSRGIGSVALWIAGSLIVSALGSVVAGRVAQQRRGSFKSIALVLAAVTGALTYVSGGEILIGFTILVNAFFLFLFFPLYLAAPSTKERHEAMTLRMSTYLIGFAFGGAAGTALLSLGGYPLLAGTIALTAIGVLRRG